MKKNLLNKAQLSIINKNNLRYPLAVAEKDYFLAIVLQIIYSSKLKDKLIFKGGTAIHHIYLEQLRFSEDLDFASSGKITIDEIKETFDAYEFLEIIKINLSEFTLKIERLKFLGPLEQANSIKLDVDLSQKLILPSVKTEYRNAYGLSVKVLAMNVKEILAEKLRAMNERATYRDFYDFIMLLKNHFVDPSEIIGILKQKELRKLLNKKSILENLEIAEQARTKGSENLYYREEIQVVEVRILLQPFLELMD